MVCPWLFFSTLKDRIHGRVQHGTKPGVKTVLSPEEEDDLVKYVKVDTLHYWNKSVSIECIIPGRSVTLGGNDQVLFAVWTQSLEWR